MSPVLALRNIGTNGTAIRACVVDDRPFLKVLVVIRDEGSYKMEGQ